jgi:hypothetical protein
VSAGRPARARRRIALAIGLALVATGCRPYGPGIPACGEVDVIAIADQVRVTVTDRTGEAAPLRSAQLIQAQAVPTAEWGVCVEDLPGGWQASMPQAAAGEVTLSLASPDLGLPFVTATLTEVCEVAPAAHRVASPVAGLDRFVAVEETAAGVRVTLVPVAARHDQAAYELATDLRERELRGNPVRTTLLASAAGPVPSRIQEALDLGEAAIVVDDEYLARGELELRVPDLGRPIVSRVGGVLAELAERAPPPRYLATWWHVGEGGCITYRVDAAGPAAASMADDLDASLGFFPLGDLRRQLAGADFELGETP